MCACFAVKSLGEGESLVWPTGRKLDKKLDKIGNFGEKTWKIEDFCAWVLPTKGIAIYGHDLANGEFKYEKYIYNL